MNGTLTLYPNQVQKFSKSQKTIAADYVDFEAYLLKDRKNGRNYYA